MISRRRRMMTRRAGSEGITRGSSPRLETMNHCRSIDPHYLLPLYVKFGAPVRELSWKAAINPHLGR